jgi:acyl carrier protein
MTREEVLATIRGHLAEELGVDPDSVNEATNLRDDLEADSLDLYTMLQELEDRWSIRIEDDQAAGIETVGQAVDLVLSKSGGGEGI